MARATKVDKDIDNSYNQNDEDFLSTSSEDTNVSAPSSDQADASAESRKKGSKSWKTDDFNNNSWGQQNLLKARLKDPSFEIRWVRDGSRSNVDRYLEQGYDFVLYGELRDFNKERLRNGTGIDSTVRVVDMVLMKLPKTRATEKKKWLATQLVDARTNQQQFRDQARQVGVKVLEEQDAKDLPSAFN